jgi:hypothetical protein
VDYPQPYCGGAKGGRCTGTTERDNGTKVVVVADRPDLPVAVHVARARPHEVILGDAPLTECVVGGRPTRLTWEKAFPSDALDATLAAQRMRMIAAHWANRKAPNAQDGRALQRNKRRWKVERLFARLQNFRRVVVRPGYYAENYLGFVQLGCTIILLRVLTACSSIMLEPSSAWLVP